MPKVTLTERQKFLNMLGANLKLLKGGNTNADLAKIIHCKSQCTVAKRLQHPGTMTIDELFLLCKHHGIAPGVVLDNELTLSKKGE